MVAVVWAGLLGGESGASSCKLFCLEVWYAYVCVCVCLGEGHCAAPPDVLCAKRPADPDTEGQEDGVEEPL